MMVKRLRCLVNGEWRDTQNVMGDVASGDSWRLSPTIAPPGHLASVPRVGR